ncbi:MAG: trypsin-like serine protease [Labilithrix sp.]|nr:trypsin-like serine protease [Labilithrix sp.]
MIPLSPRRHRNGLVLLLAFALAFAVVHCGARVEDPPEPRRGTKRDAIIDGRRSASNATVALATADKQTFCSGSVVGCNTVVTAKHCLTAFLGATPPPLAYVYVCTEPDASRMRNDASCWVPVRQAISRPETSFVYDVGLVYTKTPIPIAPMRRRRTQVPMDSVNGVIVRGFGASYGPGAKLWTLDASSPDRSLYSGSGVRRWGRTIAKEHGTWTFELYPDVQDPYAVLAAYGDSGGSVILGSELVGVISRFYHPGPQYQLGWDGAAGLGSGGWGFWAVDITNPLFSAWIDANMNAPRGGGARPLAVDEEAEVCVSVDPCAACGTSACCPVIDGTSAGDVWCAPPGATCGPGGTCASAGGSCASAASCCGGLPCSSGTCGHPSCDTSPCDRASWPPNTCGCIVGPAPACGVDYIACSDGGSGGACSRENAPHCFQDSFCGCIESSSGAVECVPCQENDGGVGVDGGTQDASDASTEAGLGDAGPADAGSDGADAGDAATLVDATDVDVDVLDAVFR